MTLTYADFLLAVEHAGLSHYGGERIRSYSDMIRGALSALLLLCLASCRLGTGFVMLEFSGCMFGDDQQGNISYANYFYLNRQLLLGYSKQDDMFLPCGQCIREMHAAAAKICSILNTDPGALSHVRQQERRCKEQVRTYWDKTVERRVKPSVEVFSPIPVHAGSLPVLVCHVSGFYPADINVAWFKNDNLVRNYTEAVRAGDWTYQIVTTMDMRNTSPEDNFTCLVDHPSLEQPIAKQWKHGLSDMQILKISLATAIFLIGLATLITGLCCWSGGKRSGYTPIPGYNDGD